MAIIVFAAVIAGCSAERSVKGQNPRSDATKSSTPILSESPTQCGTSRVSMPDSARDARTSVTVGDDWEKRQAKLAAQRTEQEISEWHPRPDDEVVPDELVRYPTMDVTGEWVFGGYLDRTSLSIRYDSGDRYDVDVSARGCLSHWQLLRTATYADGVLHLSRPVKNYHGTTFEKLYAIRRDGLDLLVTATRDVLGHPETFRRVPLVPAVTGSDKSPPCPSASSPPPPVPR
jgi:hypothetical protein